MSEVSIQGRGRSLACFDGSRDETTGNPRVARCYYGCPKLVESIRPQKATRRTGKHTALGMAERLLPASSDWRVRLIALFEALKGALALALGFGAISTFGESLSEAAQELVLGLHLDPSQPAPGRIRRRNQRRTARADLDSGRIGPCLLRGQVRRGVRSVERPTLGSMGLRLERRCLPADRSVRIEQGAVLVSGRSRGGECGHRRLHGDASVAIASKRYIDRSQLRRSLNVEAGVMATRKLSFQATEVMMWRQIRTTRRDRRAIRPRWRRWKTAFEIHARWRRPCSQDVPRRCSACRRSATCRGRTWKHRLRRY